MEEEIKVQYIKGNDAQQEEFIDFINYVFHMDGKDSDFYRLLPKLYKKENHPCTYNFLAMENDKIKAAVGAFPGSVNVCGMNLNYQGIGNVAVHPYTRSKGYMKELMHQSVKQMIDDGADFSVLGGKRNRYAYFSYEIVGRKYSFWMDETNIKHVLGKGRKERFHFVLVNENDKEELQKILTLQHKQPLYYQREDEKLYDILKTWAKVDIYTVYEGSRFAGYLLNYNKNNIREIILEDNEDITEVIADFVLSYAKDDLTVDLPDYQRDFINAVSEISEALTVKDDVNYSVFHYDRVIEAFLNLKAQTDKLADGEMTLLIHGISKDETLNIKVSGNRVSVTPVSGKAAYEFNHLDAMAVLFGNFSPLRSKLPMEVQTWLPLPLYIFAADEV